MSTPTFGININSKEIAAFMRGLAKSLGATPDDINRATVLALNDALPVMKRTGLEIVTSRYALKRASHYYNRSVKTVRASKRRPYIILRARGRGSLPLSNFMIRNAKKAGISAQVLQEGSLTPLQKIALHNGRVYKSFKIKGKGSGKELIASRIPGSGKREKIKVFYGPGIVPFLSREENRTEIMDASVERFKKRFEHHLAFILNKL
ncbi:hypothetical protein LJC26_06675 [Desulfovibrio sp. OttesenSCG-928-O18]|nr:hypothetical protein [Desulfovibrio sp. OttesenSCG-928-O18]